MLVPVTDSRGLPHSELFVLPSGLAMLENRFRLQRISHKYTLQFCKVMPTVCTPDLKAPDLHWTVWFFGNPSGLLIARTAIKKDHFQPRKLALSPRYGVTCNKLFVSIKRVTGAVDCGVDCSRLLPVAALGDCKSIGSVPPSS